jgi:hypothetical protein
MSSAADRKSKSRELRRLGYRGVISFPIHEDGIDRLIAASELTEDEADSLEFIADAVANLVNGGGVEGLGALEKQSIESTGARGPAETPEQSPAPLRHARIERKHEKPLLTF